MNEAEFLSKLTEKILAHFPIGKLIAYSFVLLILFCVPIAVSIVLFRIVNKKLLLDNWTLLSVLCAIFVFEYGSLMFLCFSSIELEIIKINNTFFGVNIFLALISITFIGLIFPTDLISAIFVIATPFIFPIIDIFIGVIAGNALSPTNVVLRSLLLSGYQIGFVLLLLVSFLIYGGLAGLFTFFISNGLLPIKLDARYIAAPVLILTGGVAFYYTIKPILPILKIFFPSFSLNLLFWIITTIFLISQLIYRLSKIR